ncbi:MAG: DUF6491 family protein [Hyphomonadaceae bacterium]
MRIMGILIAAAALAACASATEPPAQTAAAQDCFRTSQVHGFDVIDRNRVGLRVGANRQYVLTTMWNAYDLDWEQRIAIRTATGRVCVGNGLGVEIIGGDPRRTYPITSVERAPEQPAAQNG